MTRHATSVRDISGNMSNLLKRSHIWLLDEMIYLTCFHSSQVARSFDDTIPFEGPTSRLGLTRNRQQNKKPAIPIDKQCWCRLESTLRRYCSHKVQLWFGTIEPANDETANDPASSAIGVSTIPIISERSNLLSLSSGRCLNLSNQDHFVVNKLVRRNFQVQRSRTLADTTRNIVVRSMARTEPSTVITGVGDRDTAQVRTDTYDNHKFRLDHTVRVLFLVTEVFHWNGFFTRNFRGSSTTNKHRLSTPLDRDRFAFFNGREIKLLERHGQDLGRSTHRGYEFDNQKTSRRSIRKAYRREHQVGECTALGFGDLIDAVLFIHVVHTAELIQSLGLGREASQGGCAKEKSRDESSSSYSIFVIRQKSGKQGFQNTSTTLFHDGKADGPPVCRSYGAYYQEPRSQLSVVPKTSANRF